MILINAKRKLKTGKTRDGKQENKGQGKQGKTRDKGKQGTDL